MNPVRRAEAEYRESTGRVKLAATETGRWGLPPVARVMCDVTEMGRWGLPAVGRERLDATETGGGVFLQ